MADYGFGDIATSLYEQTDPGTNPALAASAFWPQVTPDAGAGAGGNWFDTVGAGLKSLYGGARDVLGGFGDVAKAVLPAAQIGATALGAVGSAQAASELTKQSRLLRQTQGAQLEASRTSQQQVAQPAIEFGKGELERATAGKIPEAEQARIEQWKQGALQLARDYFARHGISDSTMMASMEAWIDERAKAMEMAALETEQGLGLQALGVAGQAVGQGAAAAGAAGNVAAGQQQTLEQLMAAANQQLGRLGGATA